MREGVEECGLLLRIGPVIARAVQIVYSESEEICFEKHCVFFAADILATVRQIEPDHVLTWLAPDRALAALSHESHRGRLSVFSSGKWRRSSTIVIGAIRYPCRRKYGGSTGCSARRRRVALAQIRGECACSGLGARRALLIRRVHDQR